MNFSALKNVFDKRLNTGSHSLVRRSLLWCGAAMAFFCVATAVASFIAGYERASDKQDDMLKEVVGMLSRDVVQQRYKNRIRELTAGGFYGPGSPLGESIEAADKAALTMDDDTFEDSYELDDDSRHAVIQAGQTVLIRLMHKRGRAVQTVFDKPYTDGAHTVEIFAEPYRVYFRTLKDGSHVAAGQRLNERNETIMVAALASAAPVFLLTPVMLLVLLFALWQALRPLKILQEEVNARSGEELTPLPTQGIPAEIESMVVSFNGLLARVSELRRREARFVADAAHELRSPMTVLNLQVDRLSSMPLADEASARVAELKSAISRATNLLTQMLALKRAQADRPHETEPAAKSECMRVISAVLEDLYWVAQEKNIAINVEAENANHLTAAVSENDLAALVRNLIHNAVNYTPPGGSVTIVLQMKADNPKMIEVVVSDTGPGIAPQERKRVFDPFYRILGTEASGTGLGLAICKTIVDNNHGELTLDWADDKKCLGLKATLTLPLA